MPKTATAHFEIEIHKPIDEVFAYMQDYRKNDSWQTGIVAVEQQWPPSVGSTITITRTIVTPIKTQETTSTVKFTELVPNERIRTTTTGGPAEYVGGYDYSSTSDGGTKIRYEGKITVSRFIGPLAKFLATRFQSQMEGDLARLKKLLESA